MFFFIGDTAVYQGAILGACLETDFTDGIYAFKVQHSGHDGWCLDKVTLEMRAGEIITCTPGVFLDNDDVFTCDGAF